MLAKVKPPRGLLFAVRSVISFRISTPAEDIEAINPNTLTAPLFRRTRDAGVTALIHRAVPVLVRDGGEGGLKFLVAVIELEEALLKVRIPPGKGIAGLVFSSSQPMAVNDGSDEGSFWSGADEAVGFKTVTLLATPLRRAATAVPSFSAAAKPSR